MTREPYNITSSKRNYFLADFDIQLYSCVTMVTALMLIIIFVDLNIYPFGDRSLIYADGDQYFGFLGYLQSTFFTDNNLLYSWSSVLGGNMVGTFAYYCASPFNLLLLFFKNHILAGYHFVFGIKFIAAALCFASMLRNLFIGVDRKAMVLFSASYPFIGYMTHYAWNQSWMDGVIILPIMLLGIYKLINQKKTLLYIFSLAFILFSNYYIGFMLCIASVLLFLCMLVLSHVSFDKGIIKICACYAVSSLAAAAISAILLLPAFYALPSGRRMSVRGLFHDMYYLCKPIDVLSMMYTHPLMNVTDGENYPIVYVGIVQFFLVVLFFLNKEVPKRYKVVSGGLLTIFLLSFSNSALNIIWHGTSVNVSFNYRYSFILSFILELIAFYSFIHVRGAHRNLPLCGGVISAFTVMIINASKKNVGVRTLLVDVLLFWVIFIVFYLYTGKHGNAGKRGQALCWGLILTITFGNLMENTCLSLRNRLGDVGSCTRAMNAEKEILEIIDEDGLYRRGSTFRYGRCYAMLAGFAGVQNYASTENEEALAMGRKLGISQEWMWCQYDNNVPLSTDALLGIKYIVAKPHYKSEYYTVAGEIPDKGLVVLKNNNALPIIFPSKNHFESGDNIYDKFQYINHCWNSVCPKGGDVFQRLETVKEDLATESGRDIQIEFTVDTSNPVYAFIPRGNISADVAEYSVYQDIFYVGKYLPGEKGVLVIHVNGSYEGDDDIVVYSECPEVLAQKVSDIGENVTIEKKSSSHLALMYEADQDTFLSSTIPFSEAWHVYIDGKKAETYRNMDSFLAFDCPEGRHEIELIYWPRYFKMGASITMITILAIVVIKVNNMRMGGKSERRIGNH